MKRLYKKTIAFLMVLCLAFCTMSAGINVAAVDTDSQRAKLQQELDRYEAELKKLGEEGKETEEYIAVLDKKLTTLKKQYDLAQADFMNTNNRISELEQDIASNEADLEKLEEEIPELENKVKELDRSFSEIFDAYCHRMRAMYISGNQASTLGLLLDSDSISILLTRFEMIRAISKKDGELLNNVKQQSKKLSKATDDLKEKKTDIQDTQKELTNDKAQLKVEQVDLLKKEELLQSQKAKIEEQQTEANTLLKRINDKTKEYGEYRDITREELEEIDRAIAEADKRYQDTTTTTKKPTTKKPTTTTKRVTTTTTTKRSTTTTQKVTTTTSTTKKATTTTTTTTTKAPTSSYISLTYPCPAYKTITCGYGAYYGHTGCDFSTGGRVDQKIVAAESGTVIISTDLTNLDGTYRSYGRYIVIRHDKKTSSGQTVYTLYAHNNSRLVYEGQYVTKGQQIAWSGSTGNSTGPHCHFEVRVGGSSQSYAVNPANYLPK